MTKSVHGVVANQHAKLPIKSKLVRNKLSIMVIIHRQLSQTRLVAVILVSEFGMTKSENVEEISAIKPTEHSLHLIEHCKNVIKISPTEYYL